LHEKTLGIIGLGDIGKEVARLGLGLGMKVIAWNRTKKDFHPEIGRIRFCNFKDVLKNSDILSINITANEDTFGFLGENEIRLMKHGALLINLASDKVLDYKEVYRALKSRKLGGLAMEVFSENPAYKNVVKLENIIATPVTAWYTKELLENIAKEINRVIADSTVNTETAINSRKNPLPVPHLYKAGAKHTNR